MYNLYSHKLSEFLIKRKVFFYYRSISGLNLWNEDLTLEIKHKIESHWSTKIKSECFDESDKKREKYFVLSMFPYPSGHLHMGHVRVYTISDSIARFQRMNGKNVIHPIGWDAFGLPAENAAIERKIPPKEWTKQNIAHMKQQLKQLGCSFEWHRELATCDPRYYRWTQELFLMLYENGFVYQKEALVNWDPVDKTVLAEEQVDENGCSWRSGVPVEKRTLKQWFIRTTKFAKSLLEGLDDPLLQDWKDIIKLQQHWIGECNGVSFDFKLNDEFVSFWTDKPEYIEHVKFIAISPHNILAKRKSREIKKGTLKLDVEAINPINDDKVPIFITDHLDFLPFTDSHLGIPSLNENDKMLLEYLNYGHISTDVVIFSNENDILEKQKEVCEKARSKGAGGYWTSAKLRDWLISRQRYWGTPIPMIYCEKCGTQPVRRDDLPIELPTVNILNIKGNSVLTETEGWLHTTCPKCRGAAKRETDTMDTFVDSSWYYLRYLDRDNLKEMFSFDKAKIMTPVDLYIGGKEHAVLHLYYARFISHFLHSLGLLPEREPFKRLLVQGMVMGRSYRLKGTGQYVAPSELNILDAKRNKAIHKATGQPVVMQWEKMSKSKYNGVDPSEMFKEYSIDTTRLLILADVAPTSHRNWNSNTFPGILSWQRRLWLTIQDFLKHRKSPPVIKDEDIFKSQEDYMFDSRNYYVKGATFNYLTSQQISVGISKMQGLTNSIRRAPPFVVAHGLQYERALACQLILLAPIAPHFASELWSGFVSAQNRLNYSGEVAWDKTVLEQKWPNVDYNYNLDLVCQVNGVDVHVLKVQREKLERFSKEEAIELVMRQGEVDEVINGRKILEVSYELIKGYEGVVKVKTAFDKKISKSTSC